MTALRSLLEDLPRGSAPVVLLRATRPRTWSWRRRSASSSGIAAGKIHELAGPRDRPPSIRRSLPRLVPDLQQRDVYVCGPEGFVADIVEVARTLGVPEEAIHHEAFAL